ncbi:bZIP, variant 3 [Dermatophagoides farinae]|uniref:BZIP, variant 3 n=1 Tax=Dermatophagoides farinae TaxID=6954 RepID=A0A922IB64_DERFA|nr:bZIP, variant 3 [Dermatophagoides farinae]
MENPNGACSSLYILSSASPFTTASAAATASTTTTAAAVANPNPINDYCLIKKSNETDSYGNHHNEWSSYNGYQANPITTIATDENGPEYPIYDVTQNCNLYEQSSNGQLLNNCSGQYYCNNNNSNNTNENGHNNLSAVLYSSLTTLSNGQDHHLNSDLSYNGFNNGVAISDAGTYMSNVSFPTNNSVPDCFYNGYLDEYNYPSDINQHGQNFEYNSLSTIPTQSTPTTSTPVSQNLLNTNNDHEQQQKFVHTNTEDCFDKSSDSAVSSMSSDRVHSLSDNDLIDTSSESSSYNCEMNNLSGGNNNNNDNNNSAAKKKYRLFGKNSISSSNTSMNTNDDSSKNIVQLTDYYGEYPPMNYLYSNSAPYSMIDSNGIGHYNSINYYPTTAVQHNHTYAQLPNNNEPIHSSIASTNVSCSSSNDWIKQENIENDSQNENVLNSKQKSNRHSKQRADSISSDTEHNHFNRDEKRARALNIPISTEDIINLPIDEFNERLTKYELTEIQLSLIRDIRRRGKNKVAAQNCRKRKLDQIMGLQSEVDTMYNQKDSLENQYNQLLMVREMARDKYNKLYHFVVEASSSRQTFLELSSSPPDFPLKDSSSNEIQINGNSTNGFIVTNTTVTTTTTPPVPISSYGIDEFDDQQKQR